MRSGSKVNAESLASAGAYPPVCSSECAKAATNCSSFTGSAPRYELLKSPDKNGVCEGFAPRSACTQLPDEPSNVRTQRASFPEPSSELGISKTIELMFFSAK